MEGQYYVVVKQEGYQTYDGLGKAVFNMVKDNSGVLSDSKIDDIVLSNCKDHVCLTSENYAKNIITTPVSGEEWKQGTPATITWKNLKGNTVSIYYLTGDMITVNPDAQNIADVLNTQKWGVIAEKIGNTGSFSVDPYKYNLAGNTYILIVDDTGAWDISDSTVNIVGVKRDVTSAVAAGQKYLFDNFKDQKDGKGYWEDRTNLAGTCAAVSALIETGKLSDPAYLDIIQKGVEHIKTFVKTDGGVYSSTSYATYETGLVLIALALFDRDHKQGLQQIIQNGVNYLKKTQNLVPTSPYYGGWSYTSSNSSTDLSNTQFAVMGLWYGSQYLGIPVKGTEWANALLTYLTKNQAYHDGSANAGAFSYYPGATSYIGGPMTGAGLWCLAMIGEDTNPMVQKAVNWFNANYMWDKTPGPSYNSKSRYYYFVYAMAKGLTA